MLDGRIHVEILQCGLFSRHDDVYVVTAAQAMVGDGEQAVCVGRQINAHHIGLLIHHMIYEAGVLMAEAIVILPPDVGGQKIIEGSDRPAPGNGARDLQPFGMLVEHGINDVNESLVAGEQAVAAG